MRGYLLIEKCSLRLASTFFQRLEHFCNKSSDRWWVLLQRRTYYFDFLEKWVCSERLRFVAGSLWPGRCFIMDPHVCPQNLQWVFATSRNAQTRRLEYCFVFIEFESDESTMLSSAKEKLLFWMPENVCEDEKEFAFVQYIDVIPLRESVDRALKC